MLRFSVSEVRQGASAGSSVIGYTALVQLTDDAGIVEIEVDSVYPSDAISDYELLSMLVESTREGFVDTLGPKQLGANVVLKDFLVHPVDGSPHRYRVVSAHHMKLALERIGV